MSRRLDNWVETYMEYTKPYEAPTAFHRYTAYFTLSAAIQRRVFLSAGKLEWTPNLFVILVGPAGVRKSSAISVGKKLLKELDIDVTTNDATHQSLTTLFSDNQIDCPLPNMPDYTYSPLSMAVSELGTLINMRTEKQAEHFIDWWDSDQGMLGKRTKKSGLEQINTPCFSLIAGTTHTWLNEEVGETHFSGGLFSRMMFVAGRKPRRRNALPFFGSNKTADEESLLYQEDLVHDLKHIASLKGVMTLTDDAITFYENWYNSYQDEIEAKGYTTDPRFSGFAARIPDHILKLVIIISLSKSDLLEITMEDLQEAISHVLPLLGSIDTIFQGVVKTPTMNIQRDIMEFFKLSKKVTSENQLVQILISRGYPIQDIERVLQSMLRSNVLKSTSMPTAPSVKLLSLGGAGQ